MRTTLRLLTIFGLAATSAIAETAAPGPEPFKDPCEGRARCAASGPFMAQIMELTSAPKPTGGKPHNVRLNLRFRNVTDEPIVLAYVAGTSALFDTNGNQYTWVRSTRYDVSATGIGLVQGRQIDPQFVLKPGEARDATFQVTRPAPAADTIGPPATYDLTIAQVEAPQNVPPRSKAQFALHFTGLETPVSAAAMGSTNPSLDQQIKDVQDAAKAVGDLFKNKKH